MVSKYGLDSSAFVLAFCSLTVETSFIAFVICWVLWILPFRLLMSLMEAIQIHLFFLSELCLALFNGLDQRFFRILRDHLFRSDCSGYLRILHIQKFKQFAFKPGNFRYRNIQQVLVCCRENNNNLVFNSHGLILGLLQDFPDSFALRQLLLGVRIQFGSKLGKGCQLPVLCQLHTDGGGYFSLP